MPSAQLVAAHELVALQHDVVTGSTLAELGEQGLLALLVVQTGWSLQKKLVQRFEVLQHGVERGLVYLFAKPMV